jgi:hypothetical protein
MGKTHKFLILAASSYFLEGEVPDDIWDQMRKSDDDCLRVIECHHEKFSDNVIDVCDGDYELVCDVDGRLYYFHDVMTRMDIIKEFE